MGLRLRLLRAMTATVLGGEDDPVLGPLDERVVEREPGHAENDRIVAETGDVELDGFRMGSDLEMHRHSFVGDSAGRDATSVDDFELSRRGFGLERDMVALGELGVDERGRGTGVDHREGRNLDIAKQQVNGKNNMFLRIKTENRDRHRIESR
jgi:hypothetical protein